jgi:hypothetical protein
LERELSDEELSRFLVTTNFTEGDGSRAETMGLLDTASGVLEYMLLVTSESKDNMTPTAVLRADDLAASCLRGALPEDEQ